MAIARLNDRSVLGIAGEDATDFLQNIVTCDMDDVDRNGAGYGALLTPQGKIICDFIVARQGAGYHVDARAEAADTLAGRFGLYKLRASVEITVETDLAVFVSLQDGAGDEGFVDPRLAELGRRWIAPANAVECSGNEADWQARRIALAVPEGGVDFLFNEAFPHDAAMDCLNGIAFEKGCYIGQEVVSRMRHRGTARRRIVSVRGETDLPRPGTDMMADDQVIGRLGSSTGAIGIALVRLDRTARAQASGTPLMAGETAVTLTIPGWADYDWPPQEGGE